MNNLSLTSNVEKAQTIIGNPQKFKPAQTMRDYLRHRKVKRNLKVRIKNSVLIVLGAGLIFPGVR